MAAKKSIGRLKAKAKAAGSKLRAQAKQARAKVSAKVKAKTRTLAKPRKVAPIPKGFHTVTPNLTINGAAQAVEFYKRALGAKEVMRMLWPDGSVSHAELKVGDSYVFLNDPMPGSSASTPGGPGPISLWLYVKNADAAFNQAVSAGCKVMWPVADMFWGDRCGAVMDPYGNSWSFAHRVKELTPKQMKAAGDEVARQMAAAASVASATPTSGNGEQAAHPPPPPPVASPEPTTGGASA